MFFFTGCAVTDNTYDAACNVIQGLAKRSSDLQYLVSSEINPFFVIYACADCNIPLPNNFNRLLLWKHLDGILRAKCWRGLVSNRANTQHHTSTKEDHVPPKFIRKGEDPDEILQSLLSLSYRASLFHHASASASAPTADDVPRPVHKLQITIKGYEWVVKAEVGNIWYQAGDLHDDDDIACFAVIDCLTRLLPSCRGGILEFCSGHIPLLWGVGGTRLGAWNVVHAICDEYQVKLRPKWTESQGPDPCARIEPAESTSVPPRDRDIVDAVMNEFRLNQNLLSSKTAYQRMMAHLQPITT
jgi:hypothetical protein